MKTSMPGPWVRDAAAKTRTWHVLLWETGRRTVCGRRLIEPTEAEWNTEYRSYQWPASDRTCARCSASTRR